MNVEQREVREEEEGGGVVSKEEGKNERGVCLVSKKRVEQ